MKMNKKGFTLIELLAVIVILAIIALIATPIILGIINDSRKSAIDRTAELVGDEVRLAYSSYMMKNASASATNVDNFCDYMTTDYFSMSGGSITTACASNSAVVTVNNTTYTVAYAPTTGTVTITYAGGNDASKTVNMK